MTNRFLDAALNYNEMGFSVIPLIPGNKRPLVAWERYQTQRATKEEITKWWKQYPKANVGIVTGKLSKLFVIDIDTEEGRANINKILPDSVVCPVVETPRGGNHLYFSYPEDSSLTIGANKIPGTDFRGEGGYVVAPPSINGTGKEYRWEIALSEAPPQAVPSEYLEALALVEERNNNINKVIYNNINNSSTLLRNGNKCNEESGEDLTDVRNDITKPYEPYKILQNGTRDNDLFHIANCMVKGGAEKFVIEQVLERLILSWGENPDQKWIESKIQSALQRAAKRDRKLADEIREWCFLQDGYFFITDVLQTLQILTKEEKNNTHVILKRLCDSGIIEKYGEKRGCYRLRNSNREEMDLKSEPVVNEVDVRMPLQLNDMCVLSPGNIIVVAGSKSAGKTAFLMNVAAYNQNKFNVVYLNSEMSDTEFKKRMKRIQPLDQWNIKGYKCHNNFDDYIESDHKNIYIVDFLEVHDNFYEIGKPIRKIHEKLGDSVCFVGIQMKAGATLGRGGDFSAEKARLYLTMDYVEAQRKTKVTIYDAKEPRPPHENVRNMHRMVKIINGSQLSYSPQDNWKW